MLNILYHLFQEEAKLYNEKCVRDIEQTFRDKMFKQANGVSDHYLNVKFTETKVSALREVCTMALLNL